MVVEDHGPLRIFLRDFLTHTGWQVVGTSGSAGAAYELITREGCDVAVVVRLEEAARQALAHASTIAAP